MLIQCRRCKGTGHVEAREHGQVRRKRLFMEYVREFLTQHGRPDALKAGELDVYFAHKFQVSPRSARTYRLLVEKELGI